MAGLEGQKLKPLYILDLLKETDEQHPITTKEMIERLKEYGIHSERKSIYDNVARLIDYGYDILQVSSRQGGGYYLASREFEIAELKLLVDAVQSSRFITTKKSRELIKKLESMAGKYEAGKLQRQVYVAGRIKTENESIYYSVDVIHEAILQNRQITFRYMDWNLNKELVPRDDTVRKVSPWALIWRDENYYLAAYDAGDDLIKHYRVDKMGRVSLSDDAREGMEQFEKTDIATYANGVFGMYAGESEVVTLEFPNRLIGVVLDRFGKDVSVRPLTDKTFRARVAVSVSGQFFGWLSGIGSEVKIVKPDSVRTKYKDWLNDIIDGF